MTYYHIFSSISSTISHQKVKLVPQRMKKYIMHLSKAVTTTAVIMGFVVFVFYYNMFNLVNFYSMAKPLNEMSTTVISNSETDFILETAGCNIPNFSKTLKFIEAKYEKKTCGHRAIFVDKIEQDKIQFTIHNQTMKEYSKSKHFTCCYKFASRSTESGNEDTAITFSSCKPFKNGTIVELEQEVIKVSCSINSAKTWHVIYEDAYIVIKNIYILGNENVNSKNFWNVMVVGMDTMSRARVYDTMPHTVKYLQNHKWLDFRGYQKVGFNTFPNLMAFLTGKKMSTVYKACAKGMGECNDLLIWKKFKDAGYVTAYGRVQTLE
ncbi:unnamed protein product, partial [Iphiclides podalirius]